AVANCGAGIRSSVRRGDAAHFGLECRGAWDGVRSGSAFYDAVVFEPLADSGIEADGSRIDRCGESTEDDAPGVAVRMVRWGAKRARGFRGCAGGLWRGVTCSHPKIRGGQRFVPIGSQSLSATNLWVNPNFAEIPMGFAQNHIPAEMPWRMFFRP